MAQVWVRDGDHERLAEIARRNGVKMARIISILVEQFGDEAGEYAVEIENDLRAREAELVAGKRKRRGSK